MPDRIIRDELLESERWLTLPSNTARLAFVCLLPFGDALGNLPEDRLWRLWRDSCQLKRRDEVAELIQTLAAADLIRPYAVDNSRLIHIPRYRQRLRYFGNLNAPSPWTTDKEKQLLEKYSPGAHQACTGPAPPEVKRSEVKRSEVSKRNVVQNPPREATTQPHPNNPVDKKGNGHSPRWDGNEQSIDAKGRELGLAAKPGESYFDYTKRLWAAINEHQRGQRP